MECLSDCGGAAVALAALLGFYVFTGIVDAIPETLAIPLGPVRFPIGRILHAAAGNFVRALRKTPGGKLLPPEEPKP